MTCPQRRAGPGPHGPPSRPAPPVRRARAARASARPAAAVRACWRADRRLRTAGPTGTPAASTPAQPAGSGDPRPRSPRGRATPSSGSRRLGVADSEIRKAINDFGRRCRRRRTSRLMRRAADGLAKLDVLLPQVDQIDVYAPMQPLAANVSRDRAADRRRGHAAARGDRRGRRGGDRAGQPGLAAGLRPTTPTIQPEIADWSSSRSSRSGCSSASHAARAPARTVADRAPAPRRRRPLKWHAARCSGPSPSADAAAAASVAQISGPPSCRPELAARVEPAAGRRVDRATARRPAG